MIGNLATALAVAKSNFSRYFYFLLLLHCVHGLLLHLLSLIHQLQVVKISHVYLKNQAMSILILGKISLMEVLESLLLSQHQ